MKEACVHYKLRYGDFAVAGILIAAAIAFMSVPLKQGSMIQIQVQSRTVGVYSLYPDKPKTIAVTGIIGTMHIHVEHGYAWVADSPCTNKLCRKTGRISRQGEIIVCLPNRVVITVTGGEPRDIDAITM